MGAGFSLLFPSLALLVVNRVPIERRGVAMGTFTAFFDLGMGLGGPLTGAAAAVGGYSAAFVLAAACALGTVTVALSLRRAWAGVPATALRSGLWLGRRVLAQPARPRRPAREVREPPGLVLGQVGAAAVQLLVARHEVGRYWRSQSNQISLTSPRRCRPMPLTLSAPASPSSPSSSSTCSGSSLTPGISGATSTPVGIPLRTSSATASIRLRGWGVRLGRPPRFLLERRDRQVRVELGPLDQLAEQVEIAKQERRLGQHRARVGEVAHRLPDAAGEPIAALDPLVRVRVGAERDVIALPRRPPQLGAQHLGHVDLDHDLAIEVVAGVQVEVGVGGASEAVDL